jgi:hypothetical protein
MIGEKRGEVKEIEPLFFFVVRKKAKYIALLY